MNKLSYKSLLIIVTVLLIGIVFLVRIQKKGTAVLADWWNDSWNYRQTINVTAHTSAESNVYIIATVNIGTTTKSQPDNGDFRFTDQFGNLLSYYISANTGTTAPTFHIQIPSFPAGAQTFYAYYGNATADNGFSTSDFSTQATSYTVGSYGTEEAGGGPIAWWKFDENIGTTPHDSSPNRFDGIIQTGGTSTTLPSWVDGKSGKALKFDGLGNRFTKSGDNSALRPTNNMTVEAWVYLHALPSETANLREVIIMKTHAGSPWESYELQAEYTSSENRFTFNWTNASGTGFNAWTTPSKITMAKNTWYHVVGVRNGASLKIYINGVDKTGGTNLPSAGDTNYASNSNTHIGSDGNTAAFKGVIDDVKIYNYARSSSQISSDYNNNSSISVGQDSTSNLNNGLVGYWKMEENIGTTTADSSGNSNTATFGTGTSAPTWTGGKYGHGLIFDGTTDYAEVADNTSLNPSSEFTISSWVNITTFPGTDNFIIDKTNNNFGFRINIRSDGQPRLYIGNGVSTYSSILSSVNITTGSWYHIAATYKNNIGSIYVNGVLTGSDTITYGGPSTGRNLRFGTRTTEFINGYLDEIRIYDRSLSPDEISKLYAFAPGPVGWWKLDENRGTIAYDSSGNGYTGTLTNSPTWNTGKFGSAINTNSASAYINVGDPADGGLDFDTSDDFTISAWVRTSDPLAGNAEILYKGFGGSDPGYRFRLAGTTGYFNCEIADNAASTTQLSSNGPALNDGQWHYVTCVLSGSGTQLTVYVDGIRKNTVADSEGPLLSAKNLEIGRNSASSYFPGDIDDVRIYRYAQNISQIQADMNSGNKNNQILYYKFDENYGTTVRDSNTNITATMATGNSSPTWTSSGKINSALSFSGNDYLSVGSTSSIYSVSLWYNSSTTAPSFFDFNSSVNVGASGSVFYGTGISTPSFYVDGIASSNIGTTNTWHHFIMVTESPINANTLKVGKSGTKYHNGSIDEVKIYNYPLPISEIKTDFNNNSSLSINSTNQTIGATTTSLEYCIPGDTSPCNPPTARWKFDENVGGTAVDSSGNDYKGSLASGILRYVPGKTGSSFLTANSDGNLDMILVGDVAALDFTNLQSFTISSWVKHIAKENSNYFIYYKGAESNTNAGYNFGVNSSTKYECNYTDGNASGIETVASTTTADSNWHFVSCVMDRTGTTTGTIGFHIFVDGKLESSDTSLTEGSSVSTNDIQIGETDTNYEMSVGIDDLRVYSYARTSAQIAYEYNQGGPTAWWKLDECQGSTVYSSAGVGDTGTITIGVGGSQASLGTCSVGATTAWSQGSIGKLNSALNFDGTDDRLNIYSVGLTNVFNPLQGSASLWLKMTPATWADTSATRAALQIAADTSNFIRIIKSTANNELIINYVAGGTAKGLTYQTTDNSNWMHVVLTWDKPNDRVKVYINGKLSNTSTSLGTWAGAIASTRANIGARLSDGSDPFRGLIDDVRLYNYPLTEVQVKQIMNNGNFTLK